MPTDSGNGAGTGPGGVMQLVAAPSLATGGAWTANARAKAGRTVNFNYSFSNLSTFLRTLTPDGSLVRFDVDHTRITVHRGDNEGATEVASMELALPGSSRCATWSDSVFDSPPALHVTPSNDWLIVINLRGRSSRIGQEDWQHFVARIYCKLPVER